MAVVITRRCSGLRNCAATQIPVDLSRKWPGSPSILLEVLALHAGTADSNRKLALCEPPRIGTDDIREGT